MDIGTPTFTHAEIAIAALKNGKHVLLRKTDGPRLERMRGHFCRREKSPNASTWFATITGAFPAIALAKRMMAEGALGQIYHFRARYAQDRLADPEFPLDWRLQKETSGSGVHSDINSHIIDLARYLVGEFTDVCGIVHTFIPERPRADLLAQGQAPDGQSHRAGFRRVHRLDGRRRDGESRSDALRAGPAQPHRDRNQRQQRLASILISRT